MDHRSKRFLVGMVALVGAGATVGLSAFAAFELAAWGRARISTHSTSEAGLPRELASAPRAAPGAAPDLRTQVGWAVAHAPPSKAAELPPYLGELEAQARRRGKVTALDIEPGIAACLQNGDANAAKGFSDRMLSVQRELAGEKPEAPVTASAARQRADELLMSVRSSSGERKQELIHEYLDALRALPDEEQAKRAVELTEFAGRQHQAADTATLTE